MQSVTIKQGDTFTATCLYKDSNNLPIDLVAEAITIESEIRTMKDYALIATLDITVLNQTTDKGKFTAVALDTSAWPLEILVWDIKYIQNSVVSSTDTIAVKVIDRVTA